MGPSPKFGQSGRMDYPYFPALKHHVLLTEFGRHEWSIDGPAPASADPQIEGLSPNPAANAPQSAPRNVIAPLTLLCLTLLHSSQIVDLNLDHPGNAQALSVPAKCVITAHLMRFWPFHC